MTWKFHAAALSGRVVHPSSRWSRPIATTPRHLLVPHWWRYLPAFGWTLRDGGSDPARWMSAAYTDRTLVTRAGPLHADRATAGDHPEGLPTSSSTLPTLVVSMYQHAMITDTSDVLCVTGTGYGTALLAARLGDERVTSVDVDPYLVDTARTRLDAIGHRPTLAVCDITGPLPGTYDRIVSTVGLPGIPASWLSALRPGGRLVTNLAGTGLVVAADVQPDGGARGQVTPERAGFMRTRHAEDYPPPPSTRHAWTAEGETVTTGRYPVVQVKEAWELMTAYALAVPGVHQGYDEDEKGIRTAVMVHADGSWARATGRRGEPPTVHQTGPRQLWDQLDAIRHDWLSDGQLPAHSASVEIDPGGTLHLRRGTWSTTIPAP
ncbi:methyltransferase domain-containing protein [Actinacidiphila sp. bgisy144]|uniref:methyltransferase domain-containing protein n=1 Tax=Actinacidiphila sp. bgisy144 TaxID=3413791 RepID=UPI003EB942A4